MLTIVYEALTIQPYQSSYSRKIILVRKEIKFMNSSEGCMDSFSFTNLLLGVLCC